MPHEKTGGANSRVLSVAALGLCVFFGMIFNLVRHIFPFGKMCGSGSLVVGMISDPFTNHFAIGLLVIEGGNGETKVLI